MAHFDYYLTADTKEAILADLRSKGFEWYDTDDMGNPTGTRDPKANGSGKRPWRWFLYLLGNT